MPVVLVPSRTQHGVRSGMFLLAYGCGDKTSRRNGSNRRIDRSNFARILRTWFQTRWRKACHSPNHRNRWEFWWEIPLTRGENGNKNSKFTSRQLELQRNPMKWKWGCYKTTSASRAWKFTRISPTYLSVTTPREEKRNFQPKTPTTTRPLWQSLMNTFKNGTLNSCWERNFGFTLNENPRRPLIRGSRLSRKEPPSASFQPISISKQLETNLPFPARKTITS